MRIKYSRFPKNYSREQLVAASLACLFLLATTVALMDSPRRQLHNFFRTSFTHQPEKLTELYFNHVGELPQYYHAGEALTLDFSIHNVEYSDLTYRYQVIIVDEQGNVLQTNQPISKNIAKDQAAQIQTQVMPAATNSRQEIIITLIDQQQSIHLWVSPAPAGVAR
jgi:hypothetical protein